MNGKGLRLVYNPYAGRRKLISHLDTVIRIFQEGGYEVCVHRAKSPVDIERVASQCEDVQCLVVAGGDGSIHQAVNGLMQLPPRLRPVLGLLPVGTANDLAHSLGIPKTILGACEVIVKGNTLEMDLGMVNDRYFVNVAGVGLLTDVSPKVDVRVKNTLGQLAYYLKGLETLPTYRSFKVEFEHDDKLYKEEVLLILAVNGTSVGGMRGLVPNASLIDGKLDIMIVRQSGWPETMRLVLDLVRGAKPSDKLIQFQTNQITINTDRRLESDLDGEWGPDSPWTFRIGPKIAVLC